MKKLTLVFVLSLTLSGVFAQKSVYETEMKKNIDLLYAAKNLSEYQKVANKFDLIANKETTKWLPLYYASFTRILMSYSEKDEDKKDALLDEAQKPLDKALKIKENESELLVLQGMLYQARISVSPMVRGYKYSTLSNNSLNEAKKINKENPRIYYLAGMNVLNMPSMFGGGKEKALPYFQKAKEKYDKFTVSNELMPNWGKSGNEEKLAYCNK
jgi:tetratricopeptide (TPR) repeat protein